MPLPSNEDELKAFSACRIPRLPRRVLVCVCVQHGHATTPHTRSKRAPIGCGLRCAPRVKRRCISHYTPHTQHPAPHPHQTPHPHPPGPIPPCAPSPPFRNRPGFWYGLGFFTSGGGGLFPFPLPAPPPALPPPLRPSSPPGTTGGGARGRAPPPQPASARLVLLGARVPLCA